MNQGSPVRPNISQHFCEFFSCRRIMQGEWKSRDVIWKIYSEISEKSAPPRSRRSPERRGKAQSRVTRCSETASAAHSYTQVSENSLLELGSVMGAAPSTPRPSISLPRAPGFPARRGAFGRVFEFTSHGLTRVGCCGRA